MAAGRGYHPLCSAEYPIANTMANTFAASATRETSPRYPLVSLLVGISSRYISIYIYIVYVFLYYKEELEKEKKRSYLNDAVEISYHVVKIIHLTCTCLDGILVRHLVSCQLLCEAVFNHNEGRTRL